MSERGNDWRRKLWLWIRRHVEARDVVLIVLVGCCLLFTAEYENHTQAAQRRTGELVEAKLCADVGTMAAIPAPAGNPATNPSRAYEQAEHRTWSGLVRVLDCR